MDEMERRDNQEGEIENIRSSVQNNLPNFISGAPSLPKVSQGAVKIPPLGKSLEWCEQSCLYMVCSTLL